MLHLVMTDPISTEAGHRNGVSCPLQPHSSLDIRPVQPVIVRP
jgi:hypothetical protein